MRITYLFLAPCLAALAAAPPAAGQEPSEERHHPRLSFDIAVEERYDDNVLQLAARDLARFEQDPGSSRFKISSVDDTVTVGRAALRWSLRPLPRRETRLGVSAAVYRYATDGVKNWERYALSLRQELSASRRRLTLLRVWASHTPSFYLRELTDDDASFAAGTRVRSSAIYAQTESGLAVDQEVVPDRLTATAGWVRARRDFVAAFDERDGTRTTWRAGLRARPLSRSRLAVTADLGFGAYEARGDLAATPIPDDDISYDHRELALGAALPWGRARHGRIEADLEIERRDFTTTNQFDLFRFDRRDDRRELGLRIVQGVGPELDLVFEARRATNDASFPPGVENDDVTDYRQNQVSLGLRWSPSYALGARP